ncbi:MAG: RnfABCDGE type electron transport complex subunit G [Candidatus Omnitrophica bacterium]|nr:RnfABCDGE type electron transport complex subunit G [Candidatus Omnitrophota bacterium]
MAKIESSFKNMVLTLFAVTLLSSTGVGFVYEATKEAKAKSDLAKKTNAISEVVPAFDNNPLEEQYTIDATNGNQLLCYPAKKGGQTVATAIETTTTKGFSGDITLIFGLDEKGTIYNIAVLDHKETPGLGDKIDKKKSPFSAQFKSKNPMTYKLKVKKDGGDVDAITAATISSRAFCDAVQQAYVTFMKHHASP